MKLSAFAEAHVAHKEEHHQKLESEEETMGFLRDQNRGLLDGSQGLCG